MKEWILIKDLIGMEKLAGTPQGIAQRAKKENWKRRRAVGQKGNVFEYYVGDMPPSVQQALGFVPVSAKPDNSPFVPVQIADDMERVPFYDVQASAGFGVFNGDVYAPDDYIGLSKHWLEVRGLYLNRLMFITASGDSMYPTISDGDMLLINRASTQPKDGKIYVFRQGDQLWVKRVQGIMGSIRLIRDNKTVYSPVDVMFDESLDFEVSGQVVYIGHDMI